MPEDVSVAEVPSWAVSLEEVCWRIGPRFARPEPRAHADGQTFSDFGRPFLLAETPFTHVGPYVFRGPESAPEIDAAFDWFRWSPTAEEYTACQNPQEPVGDASSEVNELAQMLAGLIEGGQVAGPLASQLTTTVAQAERHIDGGRNEIAARALERFLDRLATPKRPDTLTDEAATALTEQAGVVLSLLG